MSIEALAAMSASAGGGAGGINMVDLGPANPAVTNAPNAAMEAKFAAAMEKSGGVTASGSVSDLPGPMRGMFKALDGINGQAKSVSDYARTAEASGGTLTPGEIVQLTMKCQEFTFQCQLTSNIANRSSDGVQQLFKQQG